MGFFFVYVGIMLIASLNHHPTTTVVLGDLGKHKNTVVVQSEKWE